jgi:hypothetical protein
MQMLASNVGMIELKPTFQELEAFVANQTAEGLRLEFKSISYVRRGKMKDSEITKAVSAFANSVGGSLILGIETKKLGNDTKLELEGDDPTELDKTLALENIIDQKTNPSVESYQVQLITSPNGAKFYWIEVQRSSTAPHQAADNLYYKRNGSRSVPMEHFEVEDVRSRTFENEFPLDVSFEAVRGVFAELRIKNRGGRVIQACTFRIVSELPLKAETVARLETHGLKWLYPGDSAVFLLGQLRNFLQGQSTEIKVDFRYEIAGKVQSDSRSFDFKDFNLQSIASSELNERLKSIEKSISDLANPLKKIAEALEQVADGFSSSGLHLAATTLTALGQKGSEASRRYRLQYANVEGLRDVLGINEEQAREI